MHRNKSTRSYYFLGWMVALLALWSVGSGAQAQQFIVSSTQPAIFADGVTVVQRLPMVRVDNDNQQLRYLAPEAANWQTIAYPDDVQTFADTLARPVRESYYIFEAADTGDYWRLDLSSLAWSPAPMACGGLQYDYTEWTFVEVEPNIYKLCNRATGEYIGSPSGSPADAAAESSAEPARQCPFSILSQSADWVVMRTCFNNELMSQHLPTQSIHILGALLNVGASWIRQQGETDYLFALSADRTTLYRARLDQHDTLTPLVTGMEVSTITSERVLFTYRDVLYSWRIGAADWQRLLAPAPCDAGIACRHSLPTGETTPYIAVMMPESQLAFYALDSGERVHRDRARMPVWVSPDEVLLATDNADGTIAIERVHLADGDVTTLVDSIDPAYYAMHHLTPDHPLTVIRTGRETASFYDSESRRLYPLLKSLPAAAGGDVSLLWSAQSDSVVDLDIISANHRDWLGRWRLQLTTRDG